MSKLGATISVAFLAPYRHRALVVLQRYGPYNLSSNPFRNKMPVLQTGFGAASLSACLHIRSNPLHTASTLYFARLDEAVVAAHQ